MNFHPDNKYVNQMRISSYELERYPELLEDIKKRVVREAFYEVADQSLHENGVNIKTVLEVAQDYSLQWNYNHEPNTVVMAKCYVSHPRDVQMRYDPVFLSYADPTLKQLFVRTMKDKWSSIQHRFLEFEKTYQYSWD